MVRYAERALNFPKGSVLVGSTGRIGVTLPMDNVRAGIIEACVESGFNACHAAHAVEAIMTSDTRPKQIAVEFKLGGKTVRIGGICKGAGMIQPGMSATGARPAALPLHATMLCFITTDAAIEAKALQAALQEAVAHSFNRITVDGDMSTNDTVLVLANGLAGNQKHSNIRNLKIATILNFSSGAESCLPGAGEDDRARRRRRASRRDGAGQRREIGCGCRCRRAGGGEQRAGENELAWRRPELGPHH